MTVPRPLVQVLYGFSVGMVVVGSILLVAFLAVGRVAVSRLAAANVAFTDAAGREPWTILPEVFAGYFSADEMLSSAGRWLILGKDEVEGSGRSAVLTDTMLLATYRAEDGVVRLISLPRDWYDPEYATKINALYSYGVQQDPDRPTSLIRSAFQRMLGVQLDAVLELSLEDVREVIDIMGGVQVEVARSFTDERFPRAGVDVTRETDPQVLYETISFAAGPQVMDGETALKFMRSRHSADPEEGNDEARSRRQQQVIAALVQSMASARVVGNPTILGGLYRWYANHFQSQMSLFSLGRLAGMVARSGRAPALEKIELPIANTATATDEAVLLVHPTVEKYGQWVYEAEDPSYAEVRRFIEERGL